MIKVKKEAELFSLGLIILVIGFFNLIFLVSCTIDRAEVKYIIKPPSQVSVLLEIPHLTVESATTEKEIQEKIKYCHFYESYLKSIVLDKKSSYYEENLNNIKKEIENVQQTEGIYYSQYNNLIIKKNKEREENKKQQITTSQPETTSKVKETTTLKQTVTKPTSTTKQKENITTTKPSTTKPIQTTTIASTSSNQYKEASIIWNYLKNQGYNNYVCAGILGNIMAEVGGHTLDIDPFLYDDSGDYYGICQWSNKYHSSVQGAGLSDQLSYLIKTIENEIDNYGHLYEDDFEYVDFISLTDEREAALAFAQAYERCWSGSYTNRKANAEKAYNYFVG